MAKVLSKLIVLIVLIAGLTLPANADICQRAGNVEVSFDQRGTEGALTFKFKNNNNFPVQVTANFHLESTNGETVDSGDVLYLPANGEKAKTFYSDIFDDRGLFKNNRCGVNFTPEACN